MPGMKLLNLIPLAGLLIIANSQLVQAQEQAEVHPYLNENFFIDVGVYFPERKFGVQVNSTILGPTDPIDLEGEFGARKSDETLSLNFGWRFAQKWQLEGQYFGSTGKAGATLDEDLQFGDITFGAGSGIEAGQEFTLTRLFFARRFESSDEHEFGLGVGLHWLKFGVYIKGNVINGDGSTAIRRESVTAIAPLPNIGAWYMHSLTPKLALKTRIDWFGASYDIYDGTMINASIGLNYQVLENFGVGLNYNHFELDVAVEEKSWDGSAKISYEGLYAYLSFYW